MRSVGNCFAACSRVDEWILASRRPSVVSRLTWPDCLLSVLQAGTAHTAIAFNLHVCVCNPAGCVYLPTTQTTCTNTNIRIKSRYKHFIITTNTMYHILFTFIFVFSGYPISKHLFDCRKNSNTNLFAFAMCKSCAKLEHKIKDAGI